MSKSILIASPNTDLGELLRLSLEESSKYDVRMARSPGAVWEIMNSVWIDLVILDTDLIEKELSLFVQNLLEKQSSLRYLVIPPQNNPQHALLAGLYPDGYITRPFFIDDVITQIERLIGAAEETPEPTEQEEAEEPAPVSDQPLEPEDLFEENLFESFLKDDIEDTQPTVWNTDQPTPLLLEEIVPQPAAEPAEENASLDDFEAMFLNDYLYEEELQEDLVEIEKLDFEPGAEPAGSPQQLEPVNPIAAEEPVEIISDAEQAIPATPVEPVETISESEQAIPATPVEPVETISESEQAIPATPVEPIETISEAEQAIPTPPEELTEATPEVEPEFAVAEESNAISLESIPPLEPELPPAPLNLALSTPAALKEIHLEPEYLEALQQEVNAFACLVCDAAGVYAYSGELNSEDGKQIAAILRHHVDHNRQSGLAHFLNIGKPPLETLLYAVNLIDQCFLVVLYDANMPISRANTLTGNLRRRLLGEPLPGNAEPVAELDLQTETQSAVADFLSMMPPPQMETATAADEITADEVLTEQPAVVEESIELPDWAVPLAVAVETVQQPPAVPDNNQTEPVEQEIPEIVATAVEQQDEPETVEEPLEAGVLEVEPAAVEPETPQNDGAPVEPEESITGEELVELELPDWAIPQPAREISEEAQPPLAAPPPEPDTEPDAAGVETEPEKVEAQPEAPQEPAPNPIIDNIVFPWDMESNSASYDSVSNAGADNPGGNGNDNLTDRANSTLSDQAFSCVLVPAQPEFQLTGDASKHLERWMPELCTSFGWQMTNLTIQPEYMLWSIMVPPTVPTGSLVNRIREYTSQKMVEAIPQLGKSHSPANFWAPTSLTVRGEHAPSQQAIDDLIQQAHRRYPSASTS